jgi:hypothetical protein
MLVFFDDTRRYLSFVNDDYILNINGETVCQYVYRTLPTAETEMKKVAGKSLKPYEL